MVKKIEMGRPPRPDSFKKIITSRQSQHLLYQNNYNVYMSQQKNTFFSRQNSEKKIPLTFRKKSMSINFLDYARKHDRKFSRSLSKEKKSLEKYKKKELQKKAPNVRYEEKRKIDKGILQKMENMRNFLNRKQQYSKQLKMMEQKWKKFPLPDKLNLNSQITTENYNQMQKNNTQLKKQEQLQKQKYLQTLPNNQNNQFYSSYEQTHNITNLKNLPHPPKLSQQQSQYQKTQKYNQFNQNKKTQKQKQFNQNKKAQNQSNEFNQNKKSQNQSNEFNSNKEAQNQSNEFNSNKKSQKQSKFFYQNEKAQKKSNEFNQNMNAQKQFYEFNQNKKTQNQSNDFNQIKKAQKQSNDFNQNKIAKKQSNKLIQNNFIQFQYQLSQSINFKNIQRSDNKNNFNQKTEHQMKLSQDSVLLIQSAYKDNKNNNFQHIKMKNNKEKQIPKQNNIRNQLLTQQQQQQQIIDIIQLPFQSKYNCVQKKNLDRKCISIKTLNDSSQLQLNSKYRQNNNKYYQQKKISKQNQEKQKQRQQNKNKNKNKQFFQQLQEIIIEQQEQSNKSQNIDLVRKQINSYIQFQNLLVQHVNLFKNIMNNVYPKWILISYIIYKRFVYERQKFLNILQKKQVQKICCRGQKEIDSKIWNKWYQKQYKQKKQNLLGQFEQIKLSLENIQKLIYKKFNKQSQKYINIKKQQINYQIVFKFVNKQLEQLQENQDDQVNRFLSHHLDALIIIMELQGVLCYRIQPNQRQQNKLYKQEPIEYLNNRIQLIKKIINQKK